MVITMTPATHVGIAAFPGYQDMSLRVRRLLAWAATGGAPHGRHHRPGNPEPGPQSRPSAGRDAGGLEAGIDMIAVYVRNDHARRMVAGFAAEMPSLAGAWQQVDRALADVPELGAAIARLTAELMGARLGQASLVTVIRAALVAGARGDSDPLSCLRDALGRLQPLAEISGGDGDDA
jgi:hypothetical protein